MRWWDQVGKVWGSLTGDWRPLIEKPLSGPELADLMQQASIPAFGFYFMLGMASGIAVFGLLANSAAAIIGAMIIAPLMAPIMSLSFSIVVGDWQLFFRSALTVVTGIALVVLFAYCGTELLGLRIAGSEILVRTSPTLIDLGVAMAAGSAAAFAYTRRSITAAIAGVAIAVALVPPLAVTGIGLSLGRVAGAEVGLSQAQLGIYSGHTDIAGGSFLLFLTNLVGIVVVAGTVFLAHGYANWRRAGLRMLLAVAFAAFLIRPLGVSFHRLYLKSTIMGTVASLTVDRPDLFDGSGRIDEVDVYYRGDALVVDLVVSAPMHNLEEMQRRMDLAAEHLSERVGRAVVLQLDYIPVEIIKYRAEADVSAPPNNPAKGAR
jgi:uncharacterized hydrophobic protein (TIGR00271 family)